MTTYVAMLRGINVSGHKIIKMESLRTAFTALGFRDVATYVQSGNVVFQTAAKSTGLLVQKIEAQILTRFGFEVPVLLRTAQEWGEMVKGNPFAQSAALDQSKLHVSFLADVAPETVAQSLAVLVTQPEQLQVKGREIYLYCPNGYGNTKLSNTAIEKKLGIGATTRNWKTVNALLTMANGPALKS